MAQFSRLSCLLAATLAANSGSVRLDGSAAEVLTDDLDDQPRGNAGPQLWSFDFDPIPGIVVDLSTGRVTQVTGQAETKGVQEGWTVYKLDHHYKWSVGKWNALVSSGNNFAITFSAHQYTHFNCYNLRDNWVDSKNRGCSYYASNQMCTTYGSEGEGFPTCGKFRAAFGCQEKTLDTYASNGVSAAEACCSCGGGWDPEPETTTTTTPAPAPTSATTAEPTEAPIVSLTVTSAPTSAPTFAPVKEHPRTSPGEGWECHDFPEGWKDSLGFGCSHYKTQKWCAHTHLRDFADESGTSAYEACCECSGGVYKEGLIQPQAKEQGGASSMRAASGLLMVLVCVGLL